MCMHREKHLVVVLDPYGLEPCIHTFKCTNVRHGSLTYTQSCFIQSSTTANLHFLMYKDILIDKDILIHKDILMYIHILVHKDILMYKHI